MGRDQESEDGRTGRGRERRAGEGRTARESTAANAGDGRESGVTAKRGLGFDALDSVLLGLATPPQSVPDRMGLIVTLVCRSGQVRLCTFQLHVSVRSAALT